MEWRMFKIRPWYDGKPNKFFREFYAPGMMAAFVLARVQWPGAESLEMG